MASDLVERVGRMASQTVGRVLIQEPLQNVGGFDAERPRYPDGLLEDHLKEVILGVLVRVVRGSGYVER